MKFISLFSGIGGFDLGLERAGMECVAQVEIDEFCGKVLKKHWPDVPLWKDIRNVGKENLPSAELVCGGFPCQPFSNAGKRRGAEDDRYLWPEMLRVIQEVKPTWVIGENVAGLVNMEFKHLPTKVESRAITRNKDYDFYKAFLSRQEIMLLDKLCQELEAENYEVQPIVIPACAVNAPHRRDRVWIMGYSQHNGHAPPEVREGIDKRVHGNKAGEKQASQPEGSGQQYGNVGNTPSQSINERNDQPKESGTQTPKSVEPGMGGGINGFPLWLEQHIGRGISYEESKRRTKVLQTLWDSYISKALWWATRGLDRIQTAEVLFSVVCQYEEGSDEAWLLLEGQETSEKYLRSLWTQETLTSAPHRSGYYKQRMSEYPDFMQTLSRFLASDEQEDWQISDWEDGISR